MGCLRRDRRQVSTHLDPSQIADGLAAPANYQKDCFKQYGLETDETGRYAAQFKPYHLIGLELGVSIATIMCRGEPTGQTKTWEADVVATAKRELRAGETLDGEGGFTVWGKLMPARDSLTIEGLPIGLAHGLVLKKAIKKGQPLSWKDVEYDEKAQAVAFRREMERLFRKQFASPTSGGIRSVL